MIIRKKWIWNVPTERSSSMKHHFPFPTWTWAFDCFTGSLLVRLSIWSYAHTWEFNHVWRCAYSQSIIIDRWLLSVAVVVASGSQPRGWRIFFFPFFKGGLTRKKQTLKLIDWLTYFVCWEIYFDSWEIDVWDARARKKKQRVGWRLAIICTAKTTNATMLSLNAVRHGPRPGYSLALYHGGVGEAEKMGRKFESKAHSGQPKSWWVSYTLRLCRFVLSVSDMQFRSEKRQWFVYPLSGTSVSSQRYLGIVDQKEVRKLVCLTIHRVFSVRD